MKRSQSSRTYEIEVEVKYVPFPDEETRLEAYRTHVKLFLKAKEREFKEKLKHKIPDESKRKHASKRLVEKWIETLLHQEKKVNNHS